MRLIDADALKQRLLKTYKAEELLNGLVHQSEDKARVSQALSSLGEAILAIDDAPTIDDIALLKEQEAVLTEPTGDYFNVVHKCKCGYGSVLKTDNYCSRCGRKVVKWE